MSTVSYPKYLLHLISFYNIFGLANIFKGLCKHILLNKLSEVCAWEPSLSKPYSLDTQTDCLISCLKSFPGVASSQMLFNFWAHFSYWAQCENVMGALPKWLL